MGQSTISWVSEKYALAPDQLRVGEFVRGAAAAHSRSVGNVGQETGPRPSGGTLPPMHEPSDEWMSAEFDLGINRDNKFLNGTVN